jgi:hypothetical protein
VQGAIGAGDGMTDYSSIEQSVAAGKPVFLVDFALRGTEDRWRRNTSARTITWNLYDWEPYYVKIGEVRQGPDPLKDRLTIEMDAEDPFVWPQRIASWDGIVDVTVYRGHESYFVQYWDGIFSHAVFKDGGKADVICDPPGAELERSALVRRYMRMCCLPWACEDCGISKPSYKVTGLIDSISALSVVNSTFAGYPDHYFKGGHLIAGGYARCIEEHVGNTVNLICGAPGLAVGLAFEAYPDCNHLTDCANRYANRVNFGGQPDIPNDNPFDYPIG